MALWEKGRGAPKWADRLIRALYRERAEGNANLAAIFARAEAKADATSGKVVRLNFEKRVKWREADGTKKAA